MADRILVVDDDRSMALGMAETLRRKQFEVDVARNADEALAKLDGGAFRVLVTDLRMPGMDGDDLVREARRRRPALRAIVVTAYATVESAVACVRDGATDYLMKPFGPEALVAAIGRCLRAPGSQEDPVAAPEVAVRRPGSPTLVAEDPALLEAIDLARRAAHSDATVLLEAESGAGKEVFARLIHAEGSRAGGPFVAVNCAALPRELLEAELFGHARGAFTGAHRERRGFFRIADGGTLLLDEIGEMHADLQARLLRVLQDGRVQPVGGESPVEVDVRVIAATNRNLREEVLARRFRQDLYFRLRVFPIRIPPLRERPADLEPLARAAARRYAGDEATLTGAALNRLRAHDWPGNVRELENTLQRAAILAGGPRIDAAHIELDTVPLLDVDGADGMDSAGAGRRTAGTLEDAEREAIRKTLRRTGGNRQAAAAALGISPRTLRHKLKRFRDEGRPILEAS